jgi:hypothetical protein
MDKQTESQNARMKGHKIGRLRFRHYLRVFKINKCFSGNISSHQIICTCTQEIMKDVRKLQKIMVSEYFSCIFF